MQKKRIHSVALSGILAALAIVFLVLGSLIEVVDLSMAALASLVVMVAVVEMNTKWALAVYAVASLLSLLLVPNTASVVFAGFIGYYPIAKVYLDKISSRFLQYLAKFGWFNVFLAVALFLVWKFVGPESEWLTMIWWLIPLANVTFLVFDFAIAKLAMFYIVRIRKFVSKKH